MNESGVDYAELAEWARGHKQIAEGVLQGPTKRDAAHLDKIAQHLDAIVAI